MTSTELSIDADRSDLLGSSDVPAANTVTHTMVAELIKAEYSGLLAIMRAKLKDRELAAELINEAIVLTLEHARRGRLMQLDRIGGYVFQVGMNLLRNHQRNMNNRSELREDFSVLYELVEYDHDGAEEEQFRLLAKRVIESLRLARDREVAMRFYIDDQEKETICDELGLTSLQFTQIMSRARQRMKQLFESRGLKRIDFFCLML